MGLSLPSREVLTTLGRFLKEQFDIWLRVIKSPVSIVSHCNPESTESLIEASRFALFVYVLVIFIALPGLVLFYKADITNPVFIIIDFISYVLSILLFGAIVHLVARLMFGKGKFAYSMLAAAYISAFWPIIQTTDYLLLPSPQMRGFITGEVATEWMTIDFVAVTIFFLIFPIIALCLIIKTVPVIRHIYSVGNFRATVVALLSYAITLAIFQLALLPIMQESIKL